MRGLRGFDPQLKIYWTAADTEASIPLHAYFWYGHVRVPLTRRSKNRSERKPSSPDRIKPACKARVVFLVIFYRTREANTRRGEEAACNEGPILRFSRYLTAHRIQHWLRAPLMQARQNQV